MPFLSLLQMQVDIINRIVQSFRVRCLRLSNASDVQELSVFKTWCRLPCSFGGNDEDIVEGTSGAWFGPAICRWVCRLQDLRLFVPSRRLSRPPSIFECLCRHHVSPCSMVDRTAARMDLLPCLSAAKKTSTRIFRGCCFCVRGQGNCASNHTRFWIRCMYISHLEQQKVDACSLLIQHALSGFGNFAVKRHLFCCANKARYIRKDT